MASPLELETKFLECHICLEAYRRPKTIPCLHSFCEECLASYVANCQQIQGASFPCPVCKQLVDCPNPSLPRSQWAHSFRTSFFLNDLADCLKQAASSPLTVPCSLCNKHNACKYCVDCDHKLCRECYLVHSKIPSSRNHQVVDHADSNTQSVHRRQRKYCHLHQDRLLDLYCYQCSVPICQMCHLTHHKLCDKVVSLADVAVRKRSWLKELEGQAGTYVTKLSKMNGALDHNLASANMSKVRDTERVKEFFIKVMYKVRKKQDELLEELERTYQTNIQAMVADKKERDELLTALYNARDLTQSLVDVGTDWEVMQEADSDLGEQVRGLVRRVDTLKCPDTSVSNTELELDSANAVMENLNKLSLSVTMSAPIPITPVVESPISSLTPFSFPLPSQCHTPKLLKRFKAQTGLDKEKPEIWDMTAMPAGQLILLDSANSCIKGINMGTSSTTDRKLYVIVVTDKLEVTTCIQSQHEYWGLARLADDKLAASCLDLSCIHVIDLQGKVLQSISHEPGGKAIFQRPSYLSVTPDGDIIVSDCVMKCIYLLNLRGEVRFRYPSNGPFGLLNPRAVCCDRQGVVLCVDKEGQSVIRLSPSGRFSGTLLTSAHGLSYPEAIAIGLNGVVYLTSAAAQVDMQDVLMFEIPT